MVSRSESLSWYVQSYPRSAKIPPPEVKNPSLTMMGLLEAYRQSKLKFSQSTLENYRSTIRLLEEFLERPATVGDFCDELMLTYLRHRMETTSTATAKKDRQQLLALWRWAYRKSFIDVQPRDIPQISVEKRRVRAWTLQEFGAILSACQTAPVERLKFDSFAKRDRRGRWRNEHWSWGPLEWVALLLTVFDTAERIGALLQCPLSGYDRNQRVLTVPAEVRKFRQEDKLGALHDQTIAAIEEMLENRTCPSEMLFYWEGQQITLARRFKSIIRSAGVECGPNRKPFHDIRRLSYTLVWATAGGSAATDHAGHSADLSRYYLDRGLLTTIGRRRFADQIERPEFAFTQESKRVSVTPAAPEKLR